MGGTVSTTMRQQRSRATPAMLWFAVAAGPAAWFLHLSVSYGLVQHVCATGSAWILHLASALALGVALAGAAAGWASWRKFSRDPGDPEALGDSAETADFGEADGPGEFASGEQGDRARFMALSGTVMSLFFGLIVLAAWVPTFILGLCD